MKNLPSEFPRAQRRRRFIVWLMGIFLLIVGAFLIMGGLQALMLFAAYGLVAAIRIGGSMAVGSLVASGGHFRTE